MDEKNTSKPRSGAPVPSIFRSKQAAENSLCDTVVVPSQDRWNDFSYRILADIGLRDSSGRLEWLGARFAIEGEKNFSEAAIRLVPEGDSGLPLSELGKPFASLLNEAKHYSLAGRAIGHEDAWRRLIALNDVALLDAEGKDVPGWQDFFSSEVFALSMIRSSESYFALRHGAAALAGRPIDGVDARQPFSVTLGRPGEDLEFDFQFDRNNALRGRIAVIIGRNGSGKTFSLSRLARWLADVRSRSSSASQPGDVNQVLAFAHTGSLKLFRPSRRNTTYVRVRAFAFDPLASRKQRRGESDTRLLVDIARAHDMNGPSLTYLSSILKEEFPALSIRVPVKRRSGPLIPPGATEYVPLENLMNGREQRRLEAAAEIDHTQKLKYLGEDQTPWRPSLGQLTFLRFVLTALAHAGPASVFLVDEPENFLHPNLVSRFMRVLNRVLENTQSIAILATHSPFVVREVQSAQVHVIREDHGHLTISTPLMQTLGANVASISNQVFGDDLPEHLYEEILSRTETSNRSFEEVLSHYASELSTEALMMLRKRMEAES